jgi:hypothetical protein
VIAISFRQRASFLGIYSSNSSIIAAPEVSRRVEDIKTKERSFVVSALCAPLRVCRLISLWVALFVICVSGVSSL